PGDCPRRLPIDSLQFFNLVLQRRGFAMPSISCDHEHCCPRTDECEDEQDKRARVRKPRAGEKRKENDNLTQTNWQQVPHRHVSVQVAFTLEQRSVKVQAWTTCKIACYHLRRASHAKLLDNTF